ncbi:MAG: 30S ribosomal protein S19 [Candidatus Hydrothermarchaeota archaeon]|jgi:small subunit ribosomal protein S19|nr:30S ribosomal protein S19 [Candidatus Hydrothermarchaeota archaeon]
MPRKFTYQGFELEELQKMPMDEFIDLLPARQRRSLKRGLSQRQKKLMLKIKKVREGEQIRLKTHSRDMVITPELVGLTIEVYNGKEFVKVEIIPEMIGHYLSEFTLTRTRVNHGSPGMGATRSSLYIPLK